MSHPQADQPAERIARRGLSPALALFWLSPVIAELLSGSSPPTEFFQPLSLVVLSLLYGGGAVLIRELVLRWRKGWPSIFVLGAAYGIVEEGLMVKSFFDPQWVDLGPLGVYGRWAGVNWVWSLGLTIYHAVWSIGIPILLVSLIFPRRTQDPWVGRGMFCVLAALLALDVAFGFLALTPYRPPLVPYLMAIAMVGLLVGLARHMPPALRTATLRGTRLQKPRSLRCFVLGLAWSVAFFLALWAVPHTRLSPVVNLGLMLMIVAAAWFGLPRLLPFSPWDARHLFSLASGVLSFLIVLAPLHELNADRAIEMRGMATVGLAAVLLLVWLGWRTRALEREGVLPDALWSRGTEPARVTERPASTPGA